MQITLNVDAELFNNNGIGEAIKDLFNSISDEEIETFYKEIENKKLYEFYADYGNYLLNKIHQRLALDQLLVDLDFLLQQKHQYLNLSIKYHICIFV